MELEKVLISGCLVGLKVRYHGGDALCSSQVIDIWAKEGRVVSICPEVSAGLPIPRPSSEIIHGSAKDVLKGNAKVFTHTGMIGLRHLLKVRLKHYHLQNNLI